MEQQSARLASPEETDKETKLSCKKIRASILVTFTLSNKARGFSALKKISLQFKN
jgi:hypothetical protein